MKLAGGTLCRADLVNLVLYGTLRDKPSKDFGHPSDIQGKPRRPELSEMIATAVHWVRFRVRFRMEGVQIWSAVNDWTCSVWHKHSSVWQDSTGPYVRCLDCGRRVPSRKSL